MNVLEHYQVALIFLLVGAAMVAAPMLMLTLLRPRKPSVAKEIPYECGVDPPRAARRQGHRAAGYLTIVRSLLDGIPA